MEKGFQLAFEAAVDAYRRGSIPIGCAIMDGQNECVAMGQNSVYAADASECVNGHHLAHAEINALLKVRGQRAPNLTVFTTLEPCIQCFGAIVMGPYERICYAAEDPYGGAAKMPGTNELLRNRKLDIIGPDKALQEIQVGLIVHRRLALGLHDSEKFLAMYQSYCPEGVEMGQRLLKNDVFAGLLKSDAPAAEVLAFLM